MRTWIRWAGLSSLCFSAASFAQETSKPPEPPKADAKPAPRDDEQDKARAQLQAAQREVQKAQENIRKAQRDAETARRDLEQAVRKQPPNPPGMHRQYTITRPVKLARASADSFPKAYGLEFVEADPVLRAQLNLPANEGLVIVAVTPGGQADKAGIKAKDLITKIEMQPVADVAKARDLITKSGNKSVYFDLIREGQPVHLSLTKPEADPSNERVTYWIGTPVAPVDATLRSHLPELAADAGLVITDVVADSPAAKGELRKFDILIRVNGKPVNSNEALVKQIQESEGKEVKMEVLRAGKTLTLGVTPQQRPIREAKVMTIKTPFATEYRIDISQPNGLATDVIDGLAKEAASMSGKGITVMPNREISPEWRKAIETSGLMAPSPSRVAELDARVDRELKAMAAKMEAIQQAIAELGKNVPAAKDSKPKD